MPRLVVEAAVLDFGAALSVLRDFSPGWDALRSTCFPLKSSSRKTKAKNSRQPATPTQPNCLIAFGERTLLTLGPSCAGRAEKKRELYKTDVPPWLPVAGRGLAPQTLPQREKLRLMFPGSTDVSR